MSEDDLDYIEQRMREEREAAERACIEFVAESHHARASCFERILRAYGRLGSGLDGNLNPGSSLPAA